MKAEARALYVTAILLFGSRAAAQTSPDFSGKWTLVPAAATAGVAMGSAPPALSAAGNMGSGWGADLTITQDSVTLTVQYTYYHPREVQPPLTFRYLLNGSTSRNTVNVGRGPQEQVSKVAWEGQTLAITTTHSFINPQNGQTMTSDITQRLSLESPSSLVVQATRSAVLGGTSSTTRTTYRKN